MQCTKSILYIYGLCYWHWVIWNSVRKTIIAVELDDSKNSGNTCTDIICNNTTQPTTTHPTKKNHKNLSLSIKLPFSLKQTFSKLPFSYFNLSIL